MKIEFAERPNAPGKISPQSAHVDETDGKNRLTCGVCDESERGVRRSGIDRTQGSRCDGDGAVISKPDSVEESSSKYMRLFDCHRVSARRLHGRSHQRKFLPA